MASTDWPLDEEIHMYTGVHPTATAVTGKCRRSGQTATTCATCMLMMSHDSPNQRTHYILQNCIIVVYFFFKWLCIVASF